MNFTSSPGNNNKNNNYRAVPFYACDPSGMVLLRQKKSPKANKRIIAMKEHVTIEEVNKAWLSCRRRKGSTDGCQDYGKDALLNNLRLWRELNDQTYEIGESKAFCVTRPKVREVFCASFRDRVVHHLAVGRFLPVFEGLMSCEAYACREGKGTLYGSTRLRRGIERVSHDYSRESWILKGDLQGFFMSIDRRRLYSLVERIVLSSGADDASWWLWLWRKLILHAPERHCRKVGDLGLWNCLPKDKSLFTNGEGLGLPIGNLPSQILANVLLTPFDRWAEERLWASGCYGRYVDDFVCVHPDKEYLLSLYHDARIFLRDHLGLRLHPRKFYLQESRKGVSFAGASIKPGRTYGSRRTCKGLFSAVAEYNKGLTDKTDFLHSANSYMGLLRHYDSYGLRWRAWRGIKDRRGLCSVRMRKLKLF